MTFGEKLKALREEHGMTQDDLAAKLYVSRTAISKWETNRSYPSIDSLKAIQQEFGTSIDDLISDADVQASLAARQRESRKYYWLAIGSFAFAVVFCIISLVVYNAGAIAWVVPLRVVAAIGVVGYLVFAFISKAKYQPKPARRVSWQRYWGSRIVVLLVVLFAITMFIVQMSE